MRPILNMSLTVHTAQFCFLTLTTNNSVEGGGREMKLGAILAIHLRSCLYKKSLAPLPYFRAGHSSIIFQRVKVNALFLAFAALSSVLKEWQRGFHFVVNFHSVKEIFASRVDEVGNTVQFMITRHVLISCLRVIYVLTPTLTC